jgi:hypothetical protein
VQIIRWQKAARNHCSLRYLQSAQLEDELQDEEIFDTPPNSNHSNNSFHYQTHDNITNHHEQSLTLDPAIQHIDAKKHESWART